MQFFIISPIGLKNVMQLDFNNAYSLTEVLRSTLSTFNHITL